jgi:alpha-L-fucosidase
LSAERSSCSNYINDQPSLGPVSGLMIHYAMMILTVLFLVSGVVLALPPSTSQLTPFPTVPFNLSSIFDNTAASANGSGANFDGLGGSYDSKFLPTGTFVADSIPVCTLVDDLLSTPLMLFQQYTLPNVWGHGFDNVVANGQVVTLDNAMLAHELHLLYAGDGSESFSSLTF